MNISYEQLREAENKNTGKNQKIQGYKLFNVARFKIVYNYSRKLDTRIRFVMFTPENIKKYCFDKTSLKAFYASCRLYEKRILEA